jgi:hypothetical protein
MTSWLFLAVAVVPDRLGVQFIEQGGCELDARVPQAIRRFVPRLEIVRSSDLPGTWRLEVRSLPGMVDLVLTDDRGQEQLRRSIPSSPDACAATGDGIGLVVERRFRDLGFEVLLEPLPDPPPSSEPPPEPPREVRTTTTSTRAAPEVATATRSADAPAAVSFLVHAAGRFEVLSSPTVRGGGALGAGLDYAWFRAELSLFVLAPITFVEVGGGFGDYRIVSSGGVALAGACLGGGIARACALVGGGLEGVVGSIRTGAGDSPLVGVRSRVAWVAVVTGGVQIELALDPVFFRLEADVWGRPRPASFAIDGPGAMEPYTQSQVSLAWSAGAGVRIF